MPFLIGTVGLEDSEAEHFDGHVEEQELEIRIPGTNPNIIPYVKKLLAEGSLDISTVLVMNDSIDKQTRHEFNVKTKKYIRTITKTVSKMVNSENKQKDCFHSFDDYYGPYSTGAKMALSTEVTKVLSSYPEYNSNKSTVKIRMSKTVNDKRYDFTLRLRPDEYDNNKTIEDYMKTNIVDFELEFLNPSEALFKKIVHRYYNFVTRYTFNVPVIDDVIFNSIVHVNYWYIALRAYVIDNKSKSTGSISGQLNKAKDVSHLSNINPNTSLLLSKTDGDRALLFIVKDYVIITTQNKSFVYRTKEEGILTKILDDKLGFSFTEQRLLKHIESNGSEYWHIVIDGEFVNDTFIAFDCVHKHGGLYPYLTRLSCIKSVINNTIQSVVSNHTLAIKNAIPFTKAGFKDCHKQIKTVDGKTITGLPTDGVIIVTNPTEDYYKTENLKWKEYYTVDLLYNKKKLYYTDSVGPYFNAFANKILNKAESVLLGDVSDYNDNSLVDMKVYEFALTNNKLTVVKRRTDKIAPNHKLTVENCFFNTLFPITINDMIKKNRYFSDDEHSRTAYFNSVRLTNNLIKNGIYEEYFNEVSTLIDLGAGRGQDLSRYYKSGIDTVYMIDNDVHAMAEALNRFYNKSHDSRNAKTKIKLIKQSFNEKFDNANLEKSSHIVCNYALHYFDTDESIVSFLKNYWSGPVGSVGYFAFSIFDIEKLNEAFENKKILKFDNGSITIRKNSTEGLIDVKLPFTNNEFYTERLINIDNLLKQCNNVLNDVSIVTKTNNTRTTEFRTNEPNSNAFTELYTQVVFKKYF